MASNLKEGLAERGISQAVAARRLEVDEALFSRWCKGDRIVPTQYVRAISVLLGISVYAVLDMVIPAGREVQLRADPGSPSKREVKA